jgi:6-pyruvoyltetrahydropterin/6-carboxytetrahydropterin synthase
MTKLTTIDIHREQMKFSAGHFTIFSATERENMHGHNFTVQVLADTEVGDDGLAFDYGIYKKKILEICRSLNEYFLLPEKSPHLRIEQTDTHVYAYFSDEKLSFLQRDAKLLPIRNITLEELSCWFLEQLVGDGARTTELGIRRVEVRVYSAPGQSASSSWGGS